MALFNTSAFLKEQRAELQTNIPAPSEEDTARAWRDQELLDTDHIVQIVDHSELDAWKAYRQALRDWPASQEFPATRPTFEAPTTTPRVPDITLTILEENGASFTVPNGGAYINRATDVFIDGTTNAEGLVAGRVGAALQLAEGQVVTVYSETGRAVIYSASI